MKIRQGFVSNSSSSSFLVMLPPSFDKEELNFKKFENDKYHPFSEKEVREIVDTFIQQGYYSNYDEYEKADVIYSILNDYVIHSVDGGSSDDGGIELIDNGKIFEILGIDESFLMRQDRKKKLDRVKGNE